VPAAPLDRLAARLALAARHPAATLRERLVAAHAAAAAAQTREGATMIRGMVAAAPLLGLLGTVSGMVETFGVLGGVEAWTQGSERGMARGISTALWTTELGLVVGIPGLLASRALERVAAARRREFAAVVALARRAIAADYRSEAKP
jgi:biopolymer transport protein ExbB